MQLPPLGPATWSIVVCDASRPGSAPFVAYQPDRVLRTASVGKLFLLVEVARQLETGELDPTQPVTWADEERAEDSGLWHLLGQRTLSVADLCVLVGAVSDNLATNALLRVVGLPAVTASTAALGYTETGLLDRVRDARGPADPPTLSRGTAADLADLMARLHRMEVVSPAVSDRVLGWLRSNTDLSMVASAFDLDPLAHRDPDRGVRLANKTGTIGTARADVGLVEGPGASVAYAVLASWTPETDRRDEVLAVMRRIGSSIREHLAP